MNATPGLLITSKVIKANIKYFFVILNSAFNGYMEGFLSALAMLLRRLDNKNISLFDMRTFF